MEATESDKHTSFQHNGIGYSSKSFLELARVVKKYIRGGFVQHLSLRYVAQQSVTKIISLALANLVTLKAGANQKLLLNKAASEMFCLRKADNF